MPQSPRRSDVSVPTVTNRRQVGEPNDPRTAAALKEPQVFPKDLTKIAKANANKATEVAGSVDNPIFIGSTSDELLSVESPKGNPTRPGATEANPFVGKIVVNPKSVGIVPYSSFQENGGIRVDTGTRLKEQNRQITLASNKGVDKNCPTFNRS